MRTLKAAAGITATGALLAGLWAALWLQDTFNLITYRGQYRRDKP